MEIRAFSPGDTGAVIELWHAAGLTRPWNDPQADIDRKLAEQPELFFVAEAPDGRVVGSCMAGTDGHRGWLSYVAVDEGFRGRGIARDMIRRAEDALRERGCPKVMLMVRPENTGVIAAYAGMGYAEEPGLVVMGKRLIHDD